MSETVVPFTGPTRLDIPPERVLQGALDGNLEGVVVIGLEQDGGLYFASSYGRIEVTNWLLDLAKADLVRRWNAG
jgi:hypothetical protein